MSSSTPSAAEIAAMTDVERKVLENKLRRSATRQGLRLEKSRVRDPRAVDYSTYQLVDVAANTIVSSGNQDGYGLGLHEIARALAEYSLSWFRQLLTLDEQVALLSNPFGPLPGQLAERLVRRPGISMTYWVSSNDPREWTLSAVAARTLAAAGEQLDYWWRQLSSEQRDYITTHRAGELDAEYAAVVQGASTNPINDPTALVVVVVRDVKNGYRFRLPAIVRAFVEMMSR
ncbi:hypothetical protein [Mycobacterium sp. ENV421]|uniref:hypothetical protein n=1 Tax=Mycobacterium sp. ENV421 TaxID=1213407 RepID=UPI00115893A5|nr:hypothetical protein [Mycobacterium sp. ENV421]